LSPIAGVIASAALRRRNGRARQPVADGDGYVPRGGARQRPQALTASIKIGNAAAIRLTDGQTEVLARVTVWSPATDPASTTVQVWAEAANPGEQLKPGAGVRLRIVTETIPRAVVIPAAAILPAKKAAPRCWW